MDFKNSVRIMKKDWRGSVRNKEILLPMILLPAIFTIVLPIVMLIGILIAPEEFSAEFGEIGQLFSLLNIPSHYNMQLKAAYMMIKMLLLPMFLFIPGILPSLISSDSFAGEKERKTMESIALLPITKNELIIGKILASLIPTIIIIFAFFGVMGLTVNLLLLPFLDGNILIFTDLTFLLAVFLMTPLLAMVNIIISIIISSRSKDLKSAQSLSGALITPIISVLFIQIFNPAFLSPLTILIISGILGGTCLIFIDLANKLLDIERLILIL